MFSRGIVVFKEATLSLSEAPAPEQGHEQTRDHVLICEFGTTNQVGTTWFVRYVRDGTSFEFWRRSQSPDDERDLAI